MPFFQGGHILATPESEAYERQQQNLLKARESYSNLVAPHIAMLTRDGDYQNATRLLANERAQLGSLYGPEVAANVVQPGMQLVSHLAYLDAMQPQQGQPAPGLGAGVMAQAQFDPNAITTGAVPLSRMMLNTARTGQAQETAGLRGEQAESERELRGPKAKWLVGQAGALPARTALEGAQTNLATARAAAVGTNNPGQEAAVKDWSTASGQTQKLATALTSMMGLPPSMAPVSITDQTRSALDMQMARQNALAARAGQPQYDVKYQKDPDTTDAQGKVITGGTQVLFVPRGGQQAPAQGAQPAQQPPAQTQAQDQAAEQGDVAQAQAPPTPGVDPKTGLLLPPNLGGAQQQLGGASPAYKQAAQANPQMAATQGTPQATQGGQAPALPGAQQGPQAVGNLTNLIPQDQLQRLQAGQPVNGSDILARLTQQGVPPAQAIAAIRAAMAQFSGAPANAGGQ